MALPKSKYVFKVILIGDGGVGKTSLLLRFTENKFTSDYKKTLGTDFAIKRVMVGDSEVKLQIWDLGGQELFRDLRKAFYPGAKAALIVYDITNRSSFENVRGWYYDLQTTLASIPIVLVGNKIDLPRVVTYQEAKDLSEELAVQYIETSAKLDKNVEAAFIKIAEEAVSASKHRQSDLKAAAMEKEKLIVSQTVKPIIAEAYKGEQRPEMPKIFQTPKPPSSRVNNFYQWFDKNKKQFNSIVEDLLTIDVTGEKELLSEDKGELIKFLASNAVDFSLELDKTCLRAYYGKGTPTISVVLDLNMNNVDYFKKALISAIISISALVKCKIDIQGRVDFYLIFGDYSKQAEGYKTYLENISRNSDYILLLSERECSSIGIIPKKILSYKITINSEDFTVSPYHLNNAILKYIALLFAVEGKALQDIQISNSNVNVRSLKAFDEQAPSSSVILDFSMNLPERREKIIQKLNSIRQIMIEDHYKLNISIEEMQDKLPPLISQETLLLLALRDTVYQNTDKIVSIDYEDPYGIISNLSSLRSPFVIFGCSKVPVKESKSDIFSDILIPSRIIAGTIIDIAAT